MFILEEYKVQDIPLDRLNYQFIQRYEFFLRTQYANHHNTIMNYIKQLEVPSWLISDGTLRLLALTIPA